jgi:hypothetical protein
LPADPLRKKKPSKLGRKMLCFNAAAELIVAESTKCNEYRPELPAIRIGVKSATIVRDRQDEIFALSFSV